MSVRELAMVETPAACCVPFSAAAMSNDEAETTSRVFKALSDPHRVRIVNLLATATEPACVCDVTEALGLAQPTVSFHLKKLADAGLLHRQQRGVWAYYSVDREALGRLATIFRLEEAAR